MSATTKSTSPEWNRYSFHTERFEAPVEEQPDTGITPDPLYGKSSRLDLITAIDAGKLGREVVQ